MSEGGLQVQYCYRHPDKETFLSCGRCERPICGACVIHAPVGIRCRKCAQLRRLPTHDVRTPHYLRAWLSGLGMGLVGGLAYGFLLPVLAYVPFLPWIALVGLAYLVGEGISLSVNRKRGTGLQVVAGASVVLLYLVSNAVWLGALIYLNPFGLLGLLIAIVIAVGRLR